MKLRRFEFGIASVHGDRAEVYARRGDGTRYTKTFPDSPDLIEKAEIDFKRTPLSWHRTPGPSQSAGLSKVWQGAGALYISGEASIARLTLEEAHIQTILSMSKPKAGTLEEITAYLAAKPNARHIESPILDVLARHQDAASASNATRAIRSAVASIRDGENLLVHCLMGIHRSVAIGAVALTQAKRFPTSREAFLHIQAHRNLAGWNPESIAWLEHLTATPEARA